MPPAALACVPRRRERRHRDHRAETGQEADAPKTPHRATSVAREARASAHWIRGSAGESAAARSRTDRASAARLRRRSASARPRRGLGILAQSGERLGRAGGVVRFEPGPTQREPGAPRARALAGLLRRLEARLVERHLRLRLLGAAEPREQGAEGVARGRVRRIEAERLAVLGLRGRRVSGAGTFKGPAVVDANRGRGRVEPRRGRELRRRSPRISLEQAKAAESVTGSRIAGSRVDRALPDARGLREVAGLEESARPQLEAVGRAAGRGCAGARELVRRLDEAALRHEHRAVPAAQVGVAGRPREEALHLRVALLVALLLPEVLGVGAPEAGVARGGRERAPERGLGARIVHRGVGLRELGERGRARTRRCGALEGGDPGYAFRASAPSAPSAPPSLAAPAACRAMAIDPTAAARSNTGEF